MHLKIAVFFIRGMLILKFNLWSFSIDCWTTSAIEKKKIHMKLIRKINIPRIKKTAFLNAFLWHSLNEKIRFSLIKNCEKCPFSLRFAHIFEIFEKTKNFHKYKIFSAFSGKITATPCNFLGDHCVFFGDNSNFHPPPDLTAACQLNFPTLSLFLTGKNPAP